MTGHKALIQIINQSGNFYSFERLFERYIKSGNCISIIISRAQPAKKSPSFKTRSTRKHALTCLQKYSYNTGIVFQEKSEHSTSVEIFFFLSGWRSFFSISRSVNSITCFGKKTVKAKTSNLPVVKIIQKSHHQKLHVTKSFKMKKETDILSKYRLF